MVPETLKYRRPNERPTGRTRVSASQPATRHRDNRGRPNAAGVHRKTVQRYAEFRGHICPLSFEKTGTKFDEAMTGKRTRRSDTHYKPPRCAMVVTRSTSPAIRNHQGMSTTLRMSIAAQRIVLDGNEGDLDDNQGTQYSTRAGHRAVRRPAV